MSPAGHLPPDLRSALQSRVDKLTKKLKRVITLQEVILSALSKDCGIETPAPARGRPKKTE